MAPSHLSMKAGSFRFWIHRSAVCSRTFSSAESLRKFGNVFGGEQMKPAASETFRIWHEAVSHGTGKSSTPLLSKEDLLKKLSDRVHPECVFSPPTYFQSWEGKEEFLCIIESVSEIFGPSFEYHRQWLSNDGLDWALEFSANIGSSNLRLDGIDLVKLNESGQIVQFRVLGRPPNAISELKKQMMAKAGPKLVALKAKRSISSLFK
jgi:hypothetical protein